ncbi:unnamed protein product [Allacma fusca]|uniref:Cilia- and flagella-associated protein 57 n=1 Tax=Allacma fusca TaxID=39272 RepID=A0A8J2LEU5_9HEXA|nr:unnamed protein product [Allacma fusca]
MSTYANLHPKYIYGLNGNTNGQKVWFLENNVILYPAGNTVVMFNLDFKTQQFLHGVEKGQGVTAVAVSSNKIFAAVAQKGETPSISIFDVKQNKRRKTLVNQEGSRCEYISLAFSQDAVHLASLTAGPEYNLVLWKWDKSRMISSAKTTGGSGPVYEISMSLAENNVLCAVGKASFRFFRYNEGHLKPFGFQKGDAYHFLCHAWLSKGDRLVAGTADGRIMAFERGEYRHDIPIRNVKNEITGVLADSNTKRLSIETNQTNLSDGPETAQRYKPTAGSHHRQQSMYRGIEVTAVVSFSKGFAAAYGVGNCIIYEEQLFFNTVEEHYKQLYVIRIPPDTSECEDRIITSLATNATEEMLIACTFNCQIFTFSLASAELKDLNELVFEYANCSFHFGPVVALDVAVRKSLVVTAGTDRFIRIWNYATMVQENSREFAEEIYCVSFHPTGLFVLAGCVDKIRIFTILMDDIRELKDFAVRSCKECVYSNGGQMFACANGNILQVYSTTTFDNICNMKGHGNRIRKLCWSWNDAHLYSAGADGAIYEWEIHTSKRTADLVDRGSNLLSVVVASDGKTHYSINGNSQIKELQMAEGMVLKELDLGVLPVGLALSRTGKVLVACGEGGLVRSFKQPLTYAGEWFDYHMHDGRVNGITVTFDEVYCISISDDGSIVFWKLTDAEGRPMKPDKDFVYSTEVLVTKSDLEERQVATNDLRQKLGELRLEMDYQLKRKDMAYQDELADINNQFQEEITKLNEKIDDLGGIKDRSDLHHHNFLKEVGKKQEATLENLEAHFNARLISEFEKYNRLQVLLEDTIREYEKRVADIEADRGVAVDEIVEYYEGKVKDKNSALECAYEEAKNNQQENLEMQRQLEEDADREILELTTSYERKLKHAREVNGKLKGSKMKMVIQMTEKEISSLRKDLVDRDANVHDKEKIIFDMKKTNNELEKFKFVLDYKIKELKKMIEPKEREILYLKQQNQDMETELESTIAVRNGLQLQVNELTNKLKVTDDEYQRERRLRWRLGVLVHRIRSQMSRAMSILEDHKALKQCIKTTYAQYGHTMEVSKASTQEQEAICELVRQKNHLEVSLHSIKRKMEKDVRFSRVEQMKIMHENMLLVFEINGLRRELKIIRDKLESYENILGVNSTSKPTEAAELRQKLQEAVANREDIDLDFNEQLEEKEDIIEAQQTEIDAIATKVLRVNEYVAELQADQAVPGTTGDYLRSLLTGNS